MSNKILIERDYNFDSKKVIHNVTINGKIIMTGTYDECKAYMFGFMKCKELLSNENSL